MCSTVLVQYEPDVIVYHLGYVGSEPIQRGCTNTFVLILYCWVVGRSDPVTTANGVLQVRILSGAQVPVA